MVSPTRLATHQHSSIEYNRPVTRSVAREMRASHPWEFQRDVESVSRAQSRGTPFWRNATDPLNFSGNSLYDPSLSLVDREGKKPILWMEGRHKAISVREPVVSRLRYDANAALCQKYNKGVVEIAKRCRRTFLPAWRSVRSQFNHKQLLGKLKGCTPSVEFVKIVQENGIPLSRDDIALLVKTFRKDRDESIVHYDDFLRLVYAAK